MHRFLCLPILLVLLGLPARADDPPPPLPAAPSAESVDRLEWPRHNLGWMEGRARWTRLEQSQVHDPSTYDRLLLFRGRREGALLEVWAEKYGVGGNMSEDLDREMFEKALKKGRAKRLDERRVDSRGFHWRVTEYLQPRDGKRHLHLGYRHYRNGVLYELTFSAPTKPVPAEALRALAEETVPGFQLLDPVRQTLPPNLTPLGQAGSPARGFLLDAREMGWLGLDPIWENAAPATFTAIEPSGVLAATGFVLHEPATSEEALEFALGLTIQRPFANERGSRRTRLPGGNTWEYQTSQTNQDGQPVKVFLRLQRAPGQVGLLAGFFPEADARAEALWAAAAARFRLSPPTGDLTGEDRHAQAVFENALGIYFNQQGHRARALRHVARAVELNPRDGDFLANQAFLLGEEGQSEKVRALLAPHLEEFPDNQRIRELYAASLLSTGAIEEGLELFRALLQDREDPPELLGEMYRLLSEAGRHDLIVAELAKWPPDQLTPVQLFWLASARRDLREPELATRLLENAPAAESELEVGLLLVDLLLRQNRHADALARADLLLAATGREDVHHFRGLAFLGLDQYLAARDAFQACLDANPGHVGARQLLAMVNTLLGEADQSLFREPLAPVALIAPLRGPPPPLDPARLGPAAAVGRYDGLAVARGPDGHWRKTVYLSFQLLEESALAYLREDTFDFNPLKERIYVNRLTVFGPDGAEVARGDAAQFYLSDQGADNLVDQRKQLHVTIPGLVKGGWYELEVTYELTADDRPLEFTEWIFSGRFPRHHSFLQFTGDLAELACEANSPDILVQDPEPGTRVWQVLAPPAVEYQNFMPHYRWCYPALWIAPRHSGGWEEVGREYWKEIGALFQAEVPAIREAAAGLGVADAPTAAKVAAVAAYLRSHFTYKALNFGPHASIPHDPAQVWKNRYGDCKDLSLVAVHLLRALGLPAHPALVNSRRLLVEGLPHLDQFDHLLVCVPDPAGTLFLDPADRYAAPGPRPRGFGDQPILVLDPAQPYLHRPGPYRAEDNLYRLRREVTFAADGAAEVAETVISTGIGAVGFRNTLVELPVGERSMALQGIVREHGLPLALREVTLERLEDPAEPLGLAYHYRLPGQLRRIGGEWAGLAPASWDVAFFQFPEEPDQRTIPFEIVYPIRVESEVVVRPPPGTSLDGAHLPPVGISTAWYEVRRSPVEAVPGAASAYRYTTTVELRCGLFPASEYAEFRTGLVEALREVAPPLQFAEDRPR